MSISCRSLRRWRDDPDIDGILMLINTVGGDVSCGLALAEMLASLSKPTVSLVIGDSHSIGVPLAVASDYSFIVPTGHHDGPSGADDRNGHRSCPDV